MTSNEPAPKLVCTCYLSGASGLRANCPEHGIESVPTRDAMNNGPEYI
jgi:hypothetical protein